MKVNGFLKVKNYEKFQHYKDRNPPWIKLYYDLLDNVDFLCLQDASKMHLIGIWLLASRFQNRIPYDAEWIGKRIGATQSVDFSALISGGFLENCDASNSLAVRKQTATSETEEETEEDKHSSAGADVPADKGADTAHDAEKAKPAKVARTRKTSPNPSPKPEHAETREYFREQWKAHFGADYAWKNERDNTHVKWILDQVGRDPAQARAIIDAFVRDEDRWLRERGHEIGLLVSRFNRYRARQHDAPEPDENGFVRAETTDDVIRCALGLPDGVEVPR